MAAWTILKLAQQPLLPKATEQFLLCPQIQINRHFLPSRPPPSHTPRCPATAAPSRCRHGTFPLVHHRYLVGGGSVKPPSFAHGTHSNARSSFGSYVHPLQAHHLPAYDALRYDATPSAPLTPVRCSRKNYYRYYRVRLGCAAGGVCWRTSLRYLSLQRL